jgi:hypothetical protein
VLGLPTEFVPHGERAALLHAYELDAAGIADTVAQAMQRPSLGLAHGGNGRRRRQGPRRKSRVAALVEGR